MLLSNPARVVARPAPSPGNRSPRGTLWPREDPTGRFFMQDVYRTVLGATLAGAPQQTCLSFIEDGPLLRHWAGFVIVGPGRAIGSS